MASPIEGWAAIRAIKSRVGKWRAMETVRALDPRVTRQSWQQAWSAATAALAQRQLEITRPLNRRPVQGTSEVMVRPRQRGAEFTQYASVFVRDPLTGDVSQAPFALRTDTLRSRLSVISEAVERFSQATTEGGTFEGQEILDARYAGTIQWAG